MKFLRLRINPLDSYFAYELEMQWEGPSGSIWTAAMPCTARVVREMGALPVFRHMRRTLHELVHGRMRLLN